MKKFYLTSPIYYVNAKPHIGHAYTTVACDVLKRHYEKKYPDSEIFFLTGTDEHGIKNLKAAKKAKLNPQEYVDKISGEFQKAWKKLGIDYDYFIRTSAPDHKKYVQEVLLKLKEKGYLKEDNYSGYYCEGCEAYKIKRDLLPGEICPDHKAKCEFLSEPAWFFKLSEFEDKITELIKSDKLKIEPESRKKEVLGFLKTGLIDVAVSRKIKEWGIELPWDKNQTIYVWIDALLNYLSALKITGKVDLWPADIQIIGKDILRFHAVIWPAILMALDLPLPGKLFVHGYLTLKGEKMSKSRGNTISVDDLVKRYGADGARFMLLSECEFGADGEVSLEQFDARFNAQLADNLGNLVNRTISMILKYNLDNCHSEWYDCHCEISTIVETKQSQKLLNEIATSPSASRNDKVINIDSEIEHLKFKEAIDKVFKELTKANQKIETEKPWELWKNIAPHSPKAKQGSLLAQNAMWEKKLEDLFYNSKNGIVSVILASAQALEPFMPTISEKIKKQILELKPKILFNKKGKNAK